MTPLAPMELSTPATEEVPNIRRKVSVAEEYWVKRARKNPIDFRYYMTDGEKPAVDIHKKWLRPIFDLNVKKLIIEAWPGSAKTTTMVYAMAYMIGKMPWLTNIISSVSEEQATQRLSELKEIIESERYQNVFPHIHVDLKRPNNATQFNVWSSRWKDGKEIDYATYRSLISRFEQPRDHTVFACGITSKSVTGKRVSGWIWVDDPHNETNSATPEQRTKVTQAIKKELITRWVAASIFTKIVIIMTPWAEDDCAGQLSQEMNFRQILEWMILKTPILDEDDNCAWPENFTPDQIADFRYQRDTGDVVFNLMYMLNAAAMAGRKITLDMLRRPFVMPTDFKDITICTDFAESKGLQSDWSVFHRVARDNNKNWGSYILWSNRFQEDQIDVRVDKLIEFYDETVAIYGDTVTTSRIKITFEPDSAGEMSLLVTKRPDIACVMLQLHGDKEARFKFPAGHIQVGRMFFYADNPFKDNIFSELLAFPRAAHDDCVDPLSQLFEQAGWKTGYARSGIKKIQSSHLL